MNALTALLNLMSFTWEVQVSYVDALSLTLSDYPWINSNLGRHYPWFVVEVILHSYSILGKNLFFSVSPGGVAVHKLAARISKPSMHDGSD